MLKSLMVSTVAAALAVGGALAQQSSPPPTTQPKAQMPSATGTHQFITQQTSDQWLASKFKGTDVLGNNNERIGDVSDVLFDRSGRVLAYVIGVGGFLGIGQKDVALAPASFQVQMDNNTMKLHLAMSRDDLKNAPEFKAMSSNTAPTTGQGTPSTTPPARAPAR